jgi:hypothetical protein
VAKGGEGRMALSRRQLAFPAMKWRAAVEPRFQMEESFGLIRMNAADIAPTAVERLYFESCLRTELNSRTSS